MGEDGKRYLFLSGGDRVRLKDDGLATDGAVEHVYDPWRYPDDWVVESFSPEGPKVMRHGNYFYMITAVGGTAGPPTGHMVIAARAKSIHGPWENCPDNPLVRTTDAREKWWSRGHASVFEGPNGDWWSVYHGYENGYWTLGRQTLLDRIEWTADGWLSLRRLGSLVCAEEAREVQSAQSPHRAVRRFQQRQVRHPVGVLRSGRERTRARRVRERRAGGRRQGRQPGQLLADHAASPAIRRTRCEVEIEVEGAATGGVLFFYNKRMYCGLGFNERQLVRHRTAIDANRRKPAGIERRMFIRFENNRHIVTFHHFARRQDLDEVRYADGSVGLSPQHGLRFPEPAARLLLGGRGQGPLPEFQVPGDLKMRGCFVACVVVIAVGMTATNGARARSRLPTQLVAFPGAEGAGRFSLGGRGGRVIKVTTLADGGPGSLRAAIEAAGPRIVVFDISGTITLVKPLTIREPRITIAGQSAPGDGITIRNQSLKVEAGDVVIRYIRSRLGDEGGTQGDAIWVHSGRRIILDHVSTSWSVDETLSVNNAFRAPGDGFYDVTVQWSFITESLNRSLHVKGPHGYGSLIAGGFGTRISFHHNLWAHHSGRNPRPGNPAQPEEDPAGSFHDYRSNVFYDWGGIHAGYNADTGPLQRSIVQYNFIDNTYLPGPASTGRIAFDESNELAKAYFAGNTMDGVLPEDPWSLTSGKNGASWRLTAPVDVAPVMPEPAAVSYERVLANAGASLARDAVDLRVVQSVRDRSGGLINSQKDIGGWPELKSLPPFADGDQDGMPDHWERARSLNLAADDSAADADRDGYTNLEEYLNELVAPRAVPRVTANGAVYPTLGAAIEALPATGGEILLAPGEYREKLTIARPGVTLRGLGRGPEGVTLVWGDSALTAGGTVKSASLTVTGDDFRATNLTIQNDYELRVVPRSQAVALSVNGDRAVFERVRLLGAQDTLHAATKKCAAEPCPTSRQIFRDCYIEGHVDFIFGDSKAYFDRCRIHAIANSEIMITAHARTAPDQDRAYVFDRCRITADPGAVTIYFGRPWRDYARVIFLDTQLDAAIHPEGWREWTPGTTERLRVAWYAEHGSKGLNSTQDTREPHAIHLTAAQARQWRKWGHSLFPSKRGRT